MIRTILTPIDGSEHARMALDLSTDLAARYDAELVLLHVGIRDGNLPDKLFAAASRKLDEAGGSGPETSIVQDQSRHLRILDCVGEMLLHDAKEKAAEKGVRNIDAIVDLGDAAERIIHHATQRPADLIVMGSRGFGELKGLVLGSVSHKVFHLAPCSCVTVHRGDNQTEFEGFKSILVPTDGSDQAGKAVDLASEIAGKYGARLALLYAQSRGPSLEQLRASVDMDQLSKGARDELDPALHPIAEHVSNDFIPPVVSRAALAEIGEQVLARGRQTAEAKGVREPKLLLLDGDPARAIVGAAGREETDLIVIGSRGLGGLSGMLAGSVSYKVTHSANCSCMVVR